MNWPRTIFRSLRVPVPGAMDRARAEEAFGDQVEEIGEGAGLVVQPTEVADPGDRLRITGVGRGETSSRANAIVRAAGQNGEVLCDLLGIVSAPISGVPEDDDIVGEVIGLDPGNDEGFSLIEEVEPFETNDELTVSQVTGFALDVNTVVFDGTGALMVHASGAADEAYIDFAGIPTGIYTVGFSPAEKRVVMDVSKSTGGDYADVFFPILIGSDFLSWDNGEEGPCIWIHFNAPAASSVTLYYIDHEGTETALGSATVGNGAWRRVAVSRTALAAVSATPGTIAWLRVRWLLDGEIGQFDLVSQFRYRQRSPFA